LKAVASIDREGRGEKVPSGPEALWAGGRVPGWDGSIIRIPHLLLLATK